jgi:hypothetical protein
MLCYCLSFFPHVLSHEHIQRLIDWCVFFEFFQWFWMLCQFILQMFIWFLMIIFFQDDIEVMSLVYHNFLLEFPLCYGYWIKYAAHKARLCTTRYVMDVYEQAVHAVPHSVDIWVNYCGFGICAFEEPAHVRRWRKHQCDLWLESILLLFTLMRTFSWPLVLAFSSFPILIFMCNS